MMQEMEYFRLCEVGLKVLRILEDKNGSSIQHAVILPWEHPSDPMVTWKDLYGVTDKKNALSHLDKLRIQDEDVVVDGLPTVKDRLRALSNGLTLVRVTTDETERYTIEFCRPAMKIWQPLEVNISTAKDLESKLMTHRLTPRIIILPGILLVPRKNMQTALA